MKIGSVRSLAELKEVLENPKSEGPDPVYWVFSELAHQRWANLTIIAPGSFSGEFPKTYGHYHPENAPDEIYHLIDGEGVLLMQKKKITDGKWIEDEVDEVVLIKAKPGDEIVIKPLWGHSWSNIGQYPLLSYDDWRFGHKPSDYEVIERLDGMAYYLNSDKGEIKAVPNPKYKNLPEPKWMSASEFAALNDPS